jgi:hypothetical protein
VVLLLPPTGSKKRAAEVTGNAVVGLGVPQRLSEKRITQDRQFSRREFQCLSNRIDLRGLPRRKAMVGSALSGNGDAQITPDPQ